MDWGLFTLSSFRAIQVRGILLPDGLGVIHITLFQSYSGWGHSTSNRTEGNSHYVPSELSSESMLPAQMDPGLFTLHSFQNRVLHCGKQEKGPGDELRIKEMEENHNLLPGVVTSVRKIFNKLTSNRVNY
jgi:hypothetical protein